MQILRLEQTILLASLVIGLTACGESGMAPVEQVKAGLSPRIPAAGQANWTLEERMSYYDVPGVSLAVVDGNEIVLSAAFGLADRESSTPVTEETLFPSSAASKLVTEVTATRLFRDGKLDLDARADDVLDSWKLVNPWAGESPATIRQLLNYEAGVNVADFPGYRPGDELPTLLEVLEGAAPANTQPVRVIRRPGDEVRRSAGGYAVVQQALTDVTGRPFDELVKATVFERLGMSLSTLEQPLSAEKAARAAVGYAADGTPVEGGARIHPELAASGLRTTPRELARVLLEIMRAAQGESGGLLAAQAVAEVLEPLTARLRPGRALRIGEVDQVEGFSTGFFYYPYEGKAAVVMTNRAGAGEFVSELLRAIARVYQWPDMLNPEIEPLAMTADELDLFTGRYAVGSDNVIFVTRGEGCLLMRPATNPRPVPLVPVAVDTFVNQANNARITFRRERDGHATAYTFRRRRTRDEIVYPRVRDGVVRAVELLAEGRIEEGREAYRQLDPPLDLLRINEVGYQFFSQGNYDAARVLFEVAAEFYPWSANIYDSLGEVLVAQGKEEEAVEAFRQVSVFLLTDDSLTDDDFRAYLTARARYHLSRLEG